MAFRVVKVESFRFRVSVSGFSVLQLSSPPRKPVGRACASKATPPPACQKRPSAQSFGCGALQGQ